MLAGRLQGCLYRADMCEALLVDFPKREKALREVSAWVAGAVRLSKMINPLKQEQAIALIMIRQNVSWLAAIRIYKNMSRTDAAKMLNITPDALKRIEKKEQISAHIKSRMAKIYGCQEALLVCPSWMHARTE